MKYYSLVAASQEEPSIPERFGLFPSARGQEEFETEYRAAREIGVIRLGESRLYFRNRRRIYYIAYGEIQRCFRRVLQVPAKMCCGRGDLAVEHLVICDGKTELAQIELPGTRAARALMEELKKRAPQAAFAPEKAES